MILANQFGRPTYYYFPRPVFRSHMCIVYTSFSEYKIAHALNFGSCYAQISTSRCVAFGGVTSCTLVCFPLLLSPGCFVRWAVHVSVSCVGVCLTHSRCYCVWVHLRVYLHFKFFFVLYVFRWPDHVLLSAVSTTTHLHPTHTKSLRSART